MNNKGEISTILFGLDGVVVDTECYYDRFWEKIAKDNDLKINNFAAVIKGMTINAVIELYFAISTKEEQQAIRNACSEMEESIDYKKIVIPGFLEFVKYAKEAGYKLGIVTSSRSAKVKAVLEQLDLLNAFDTVITSDSIKKGKPDPMGYVLAQTNLRVLSNECVVFEDTFNGIKAATYAFMRVIGISTTLETDFLKDYTKGTISDFTNLEQLKGFLK